MIANRKMDKLIDIIKPKVVDSPVVSKIDQDLSDLERELVWLRRESMGSFARVVERAIKVYCFGAWGCKVEEVIGGGLLNLYFIVCAKSGKSISKEAKDSLDMFLGFGIIVNAKHLREILDFFRVDDAHFISMCIDAGVEKEYAGMLELSSGSYTFKE